MERHMETHERQAWLSALAEQMAAVEAGANRKVADDSRGQRPERTVEVTGATAGSVESSDRPIDKETAAAKAICLRLLAAAPRPRAGLAQALKRKEISDEI